MTPLAGLFDTPCPNTGAFEPSVILHGGMRQGCLDLCHASTMSACSAAAVGPTSLSKSTL